MSDQLPGTALDDHNVQQKFDALSGQAFLDRQLAEAGLAVYGRLLSVYGHVVAGFGPASVILTFQADGGIVEPNGQFQARAVPTIPLVATDLAAAQKITKLRVKAQVGCNLVAPGGTFTVGLYPVSVAAALNNNGMNFLLGTVVAGSTATITTPANNVFTTAVSADINMPPDGTYTIGFDLTGGTAANSFTTISAYLDVRNVSTG